MNIKEFYDGIGVDNKEIMRRFGQEERIKKFLRMFLRDTTEASLEKAFEENNMKEAFLHAHTMKGVALNLSLQPLFQCADQLTEQLRTEEVDLNKARALYEQLKVRYNEIVERINGLG